MLVLSRHQNERVFVYGPDGHQIITITLTEVRGGKVGLGFEAHRDYKFLREEVAGQQNATAATALRIPRERKD